MKIKTKKFVELDISDNELGKCLFNKVSEILGYGANTSYTVDPVQDKYSEKSVAGRVASAIRKAAATNTTYSNKADKEDYFSKTTAG